MTTVTMPSLEELEQRFADALTTERAGFWEAADCAALALGMQPTRKAKCVVARSLAVVAHASSNYVRQLATLSESFGTEYRKPDVAMSLYRSVARAAKRLNRHAGELLDEALAKGMHAADVSALGRPGSPRQTRLAATCGDCGSRVTVVTTLRRGLAIHCAVCLSLAMLERRHEDDPEYQLPTLGVLEAV